MHADTKRKASREKRVSMISPTTAELVASGAKKISAWVEITAACLTGRIASMWSRRLRVPAGGTVTMLTLTLSHRKSATSGDYPETTASSQAFARDDRNGVTQKFALSDLPGRVDRQT